MERNDYIHIFNKFLENKATPSEIKLLIEWLKERKAFDTWADDIWMQSPMEMDPSVKQHLLDELRKQIFFKETGKRTFMSFSPFTFPLCATYHSNYPIAHNNKYCHLSLCNG